MTSTIERIQSIQPTPHELELLIAQRGGIRASVYLPVKHAPSANQTTALIVRDLIQKVSASLTSNGMHEDAIADFVAPLHGIATPSDPLLRTTEALGVFISQEAVSSIEIPYAVEPTCHVGNRFHIKPLLRLHQRNPSFTVLCLNRGDVRVFRGSRTKIETITVPKMPTRMEDIAGIDDPEKSLQHHTGATISERGRTGSAISAVFHGHGLPSDLEDSQFQRFFRTVGQTIDKYLTNKNDALVVFGVEQNIGLFKKLHNFNGRTLLFSAHDAHMWSVDRVRDEAWTLLRGNADTLQEASIKRLSELLGRNEAIAGVENCALAAAMGRIDVAAVAADREIYGQCDLDNMKVRIIEEGEPLCGNDLLDYIASETLRNGGRVIALPGEKIPGGRDVVASTRFPVHDASTANESSEQ